MSQSEPSFLSSINTTNTSVLYDTFHEIPLGTSVYILHGGFIKKGILVKKHIDVDYTLKSKGGTDIEHDILLTLKLVEVPASAGIHRVVVTDEPVALTKEELIKKISLD